MFRLIRFLGSCLLLSVFLWFAVSVPIGKRTLLGHIVRIARTEEARELADGAKETARDVARRTVEELKQPEERPPAKRRPAAEPAPRRAGERRD